MSAQIRRIDQNTVPTPSRYIQYRTCDRKKVYGSMKEGWDAVQHIQRRGNDPYPDFELRPYQCRYCHEIHVGHSNKPRVVEARLASAH